MAPRDDFRKLSTFDLRPVFISLGLPPSSFNTAAQPQRTALFDAALNADPSRPDSLWLFKGSDYFTFNLRTGSFEGDAKQIAGNWGGNSWPITFSSGIDGAAWAGPVFPHLWYMFKDDQYIRLNSSQGGSWLVDIGPEPLVNGWFSAQETWFGTGCDASLYGIGSAHHAKLHLFKNNEYVRHNFLDGHADMGPGPISNFWNLPEPFSNKIEMAFYGTGAEEEQIFFFSGTQCALYDTEAQETIKVFPIEERFPAFAEFMRRPQLFLVEDYRLEAYLGPPQLGRLVETRNVTPGSETRTLMVTETIDSSTTTLRQSMLDSQDASVVNNFNEQLDKKTAKEEGSEKYGYHMNADFHGDASATSMWGGEVNAQLNVQGGSESLRSNLAESVFETIGSQVTETTQQLKQRTYESAEAIEHKERVLKQEEIVLKNTTDRLRVFEFYQQLQPYITLLVLKDVRIAYADGTAPAQIVDISRFGKLVSDKLTDEAVRAQVMQYVAGELAAVEDQDGQAHSLIQSGATSSALALLPNPTTIFRVQHANGDVQEIATKGLVIKAAKDWLAPTLTMIAVEAS
ncbi:MAG TPA: hypothetical protein VGD69_27665 [Herpetosiphonaceae bacterium]